MPRNTVVVEGAMAQRVHVVVCQGCYRGAVGVQTFLVVHYPIDGVFPPALTYRAASTRPPSAVPGYDRASLDPSGGHRLRRHTVVVNHRWLRLWVLNTVQRTRLFFLLSSLRWEADLTFFISTFGWNFQIVFENLRFISFIKIFKVKKFQNTYSDSQNLKSIPNNRKFHPKPVL